MWLLMGGSQVHHVHHRPIVSESRVASMRSGVPATAEVGLPGFEAVGQPGLEIVLVGPVGDDAERGCLETLQHDASTSGSIENITSSAKPRERITRQLRRHSALRCLPCGLRFYTPITALEHWRRDASARPGRQGQRRAPLPSPRVPGTNRGLPCISTVLP